MHRNPQTIDTLQKRFEALSPATRISNCLKALVAEGSINPDEIISLIRLEPLLATRILREANMTNSKARGPYACIEDAVTVIGFDRMYEILGIHAFSSSEENSVFAEPIYSTELWKRSVTTAICMESLAMKHELDPQVAYTIGLLHSLGEALTPEAEIHPQDNQDNDPYGNLNKRLKSYSTAGQTYLLLKEWGMPDALIDPIHYQYSPLDCQSTGKTACLLNLAKWITGVIREIDELPEQSDGPDILVLNLLGEGEQTLWNLVTEVSDNLRRADSILEGSHNEYAS